MSRYSSHHDVGGEVGSTLLFLGLALLVVVGFLVVGIGGMLIQVFLAHPKNRFLWASLGFFLFSAFLVLVTQGNSFCTFLTGLSFVMLLLTATVVKLHADELLKREQATATLLTDTIQHPWWPDQDRKHIA